jgi:hypothetical protein
MIFYSLKSTHVGREDIEVEAVLVVAHPERMCKPQHARLQLLTGCTEAVSYKWLCPLLWQLWRLQTHVE